jgi:hypothetical protein
MDGLMHKNISNVLARDISCLKYPEAILPGACLSPEKPMFPSVGCEWEREWLTH